MPAVHKRKQAVDTNVYNSKFKLQNNISWVKSWQHQHTTQNKKMANNVIIVTDVQLTFRSRGFWVFFNQGVSPQMKSIYLSAQVHKLTPPSPLHTTFPTPDYHHSQTLGLKQSQLRIVMKSRLNQLCKRIMVFTIVELLQSSRQVLSCKQMYLCYYCIQIIIRQLSLLTEREVIKRNLRLKP